MYVYTLSEQWFGSVAFIGFWRSIKVRRFERDCKNIARDDPPREHPRASQTLIPWEEKGNQDFQHTVYFEGKLSTLIIFV